MLKDFIDDLKREFKGYSGQKLKQDMLAGLTSTAAIARSSVGIKSGGQTRLVSIFHSLGLLIAMFLLAPVMSQIPLAALAGVLMVTAWRMNEWRSIRYMFSKRLVGAISLFLITMFATIIFDLTQAIIIGVAFASLLFMLKIANVEIIVQSVDEKRLMGRHIASADKPLEHIRVVYCTGPLFFANVQKLRAQLANLAKGKVIILSMRGVPMIDTTGLQCLEELHLMLQSENRRLMLCGLQPQVANMLQKSSLTQSIGEKMIFWGAAEAIIAAQDMGAA